MNQLEDRARRLLDVARSLHSSSAADAERVRARLEARVIADPRLLEPAASAALGGTGVLGKVLVAFAVGGSAGFVAGLFVAQAWIPAARPLAPSVLATSHDGNIAVAANETIEAPSASVQTRPDPAPVGAMPPSGAADGLPRTAPSTPMPPREPRAASLVGASQLKAELDGLRRAQELLHKGSAAWAIARLDELDRANVSSVLLEDRLATRAIAECMLGRDPQPQIDDFARQFPRSAHLDRVRASCSEAYPKGQPARNRKAIQTETPGSPHK